MIPLDTERLRLRRLEPRDAARLAEYRSDAAVALYQSWETMTIDEAAAFINGLPERLLAMDGEWSQIAIADKATGELLGDIGLCRHAPGNVVEIGFTMAPAAQGRGLAAEACRAVIGWVLSLPDVRGLVAVVDRRNAAAIALVQRLGMTLDRSETAEFKGAPCREDHYVLEADPVR